MAGQHNGTIGNGDTIGSYQHDRSNTIVVSLTSPAINSTTQVDTDSPPHHTIKPPAYDQSEAPPPIDASSYPLSNSHQQPPPAYEADPSKQYPQGPPYHQAVIVEQPRQVHVITKNENVHDFLAVSIVLAIICCCVSIPTLLCTLPAIAFAAAARDQSNIDTAKRYNCIAIFLNITAVLTGIIITATVITVRATS